MEKYLVDLNELEFYKEFKVQYIESNITKVVIDGILNIEDGKMSIFKNKNGVEFKTKSIESIERV